MSENLTPSPERGVTSGRLQVQSGAGVWTHFPDRIAYRFIVVRQL
jgi:hypothetical protein